MGRISVFAYSHCILLLCAFEADLADDGAEWKGLRVLSAAISIRGDDEK
ncbi:MAG: hypothetical protein AAFN12_16175 [Cyanobacteria bacterium J06560_2]